MAQFQPEKGVSFIVLQSPASGISVTYPSAPYGLAHGHGLSWPTNGRPDVVNMPVGASLPEPPAAPGDKGPKGIPVGLDGCFTASFTDQSVRKAFIRKVFLILTCQLIVTVAFISVFVFHEPLKRWVQAYGHPMYIASYVIFATAVLSLLCCSSLAKRYPGNFICLAIVTVTFSFMTALISSYHKTEIVIIAVVLTAVVCISVTGFAFQNKVDFTRCSGIFFVLLMLLIFVGTSCLITNHVWGRELMMKFLYGGIGAAVFALFLVFDTQYIIDGDRFEISPEDYILCALVLYLDVGYIFLYLLSLLGRNC